jgi:hypothetical protein
MINLKTTVGSRGVMSILICDINHAHKTNIEPWGIRALLSLSLALHNYLFKASIHGYKSIEIRKVMVESMDPNYLREDKGRNSTSRRPCTALTVQNNMTVTW